VPARELSSLFFFNFYLVRGGGMNDFFKGVVRGAVVTVVVFGFVAALLWFQKRGEKIVEAWEVQNEIERVYEDYNNMGAVEFLETVPDVRAAADRGIERIRSKRDEVIQRVRSGELAK
jgi:hypothetical protein